MVKPKAREELAVVELDGEAVVYDDLTGELHYLNQTATLIYSFCDGTATTQELAGDVALACGVAVEEVEGHVGELIDRFGELGLLEVEPAER